jgi:LysM repeat protein
MTIYTPRNRTTGIVIHCSATRASQDVGVKEIRSWHRDRGFIDIGYHYVIRLNGDVEVGRPIHTVGSHVSGHNSETVGICLVGGLNDKTGKAENTFNARQMASLVELIRQTQRRYPQAQSVKGHRDYSKDINRNGVIEAHERMKECPCFDVIPWWDAIEEIGAVPTRPDTYTVVPGQTYWSISRLLKVDLEDLMEANPQVPPHALKVGTILNVPS